jgi:hypothetical protein
VCLLWSATQATLAELGIFLSFPWTGSHILLPSSYHSSAAAILSNANSQLHLHISKVLVLFL